jgi:hypothetical protein
MKYFAAAAALAAAAAVEARTITVVNKCTMTIWPGLYTDMHVANNVKPDHPTGYVFLHQLSHLSG